MHLVGGFPVSAPARVVARLAAAEHGPKRVLHAGPDAVYVDLDGQALGVVSARAAQVPCALRSRLSHLPQLREAWLHVDARGLLIGGSPLVVGRICSTATPRIDLTSRSVDADIANDETSAPPQRLRPADVASLVGAGSGLTPYGDDVLCGWLAMHRAAGVTTSDVDAAVTALLPRTTMLSATLLECAMHGEVLPEFAAYVAALTDIHQDEPAAARALAAVGHTSGAGLLEGARRALYELTHHQEVAA